MLYYKYDQSYLKRHFYIDCPLGSPLSVVLMSIRFRFVLHVGFFFFFQTYIHLSSTQLKAGTYMVSALVLTQGCAASVCQRPERPRWWEQSCCIRVLLTGSGSRPDGGLHTWLCCTPASVLSHYFKSNKEKQWIHFMRTWGHCNTF